jgi:AAA-like domain
MLPLAESPSGRPLQPPGAAYDPEWHVPREREESATLGFLATPVAPAVLWGPDRFGKTWLLDCVLARLRQVGEQGCRVVRLDLERYRPGAEASLDAYLRAIAGHILTALELSDVELSTAWGRPGPPTQKLSWLMRRQILPLAGERLILALDNVDAVCAFSFQDDFFGLLRAWVEQSNTEPWSGLRLLLALATSPVLLRTTTASSPFNLAPPIELDDFDAAQISQLAARHGVEWSDEDSARLMAWVGGHPYLARLAVFQMARQGVSLSTVLESPASQNGVFGEHLSRCLSRLRERPRLWDAVHRLLDEPAASISSESYHCLSGMGLIVQEGGASRLRYPLYERFFRTVR